MKGDAPLAATHFRTEPQPESWVLTAMMTAPFTVGTVSVLTIATALVETALRRRRTVSL